MAETLRINFVTGAARRYVPELEALAAVPDRVASAIEGQPASWLCAPLGGAAEWSPARILGHLIAYAGQSHENLDRMAWMTDPILKLTDDEAVAAAHNWEAQDAPRLLDQLAAALGESVELVKELPDASWGRPGQHPQAGRRSVRQQVVAMTAHLEEHIAQLGRR